MQPFSSQKRFLHTAGILTAVYLCAVFLVHPLVFSNFYFNITETKLTFYLVSSGLYLLLLLFARIAFPPDYGTKAAHAPLHPAVLALAALFVVSVIGALIGRYPGEAFLGENNRYQGLLTLLCYALVSFALSRRVIDLRWPERAILLGAVLVSLLGILNHFGVDPLGFYSRLRQSDQGRFLSTIGNADFYGGYLVMAFTVSLGYFLRAETRHARIFAAVALVCVSFGALVAGSDCAALGLLVCGMVYPLFLFADPAAMRRFALGWGLFFLCAFAFGLISPLLPSATYLSFFTAALSRASVSLPLAAAAVLVWLLLRHAAAEKLARLKKPYWIALAAAFALGALALALVNTVFADAPLGSLSRYLRFNASWGTDRGRIWAFAARFYDSLPPVQKLFGAGSGALFHADAARPLFSDASLDTAHNEYLQYLVTNGALGLFSYLAALALAVRTGIIRCKTQPVYRALVVAVVAYAAQAVVNIAQPMTTPIFFALLAVLISRTEESPRTEPPSV